MPTEQVTQQPEKKEQQPVLRPESISETIRKFRALFPGVDKKRHNSYTNSYYASLDDVWNAAWPYLVEVGLDVDFWVTGGKLFVSLSNKDGQQRTSDVELPDSKESPQRFGGSLTYYRRYLVCTMLGIVETDDDDGNSSEREGAKSTPPISDKQKSEIHRLISETGTNKERVLEHIDQSYHKPSIDSLSYAEAAVIRKMLEDRAKRLKEQPA